MVNNLLKLERNILDIPYHLKLLFWEFVRGDKIASDLDQYIYSSKELPLIFTELSYDHLIMVDYRDKDEVSQIKQELFKILTSVALNCLCITICNTARFSITNDGPYRVLDDYIRSLLKNTSIKAFSGQHPIHKSDWYFGAELNTCKVCNTLWFTVQEECFCDYYFVRLTQEEFDAINSDTSWPNEKWPESLRSWESFSKDKFTAWDTMYLVEKHSAEVDKNILENLLLCIRY